MHSAADYDELLARADAPPVEGSAVTQYDLSAVVTHKGTFSAGHYYCLVRNAANEREQRNQWLKLDDNTLQAVSPATPHSQSSLAYVLFYRLRPQTA